MQGIFKKIRQGTLLTPGMEHLIQPAMKYFLAVHTMNHQPSLACTEIDDTLCDWLQRLAARHTNRSPENDFQDLKFAFNQANQGFPDTFDTFMKYPAVKACYTQQSDA
jgi:hypothetical protein